MANNPFMPFLEDYPEMLYRAFLPGGTTPFQDYWKSQYGDVYGGYLGQLGKMALAGQEPTTDFYDYLKGYPFLENWYRQSPSQRGETTTPRLRWNV